MRQFKTTLGLTNEGGARVTPLTLNLDRAAKPAKNIKLYTVNIHSIRLKTDREMTFKTATQAAEFIESMNDSIYFLTNIIK